MRKSLIFFLTLFIMAMTMFSANIIYIQNLHNTDLTLMKKVGINVKEKLYDANINFSESEQKLFKDGQNFLNKKYDTWNAYRIFSYLVNRYRKDEYRYYLGMCYYFMAEMYYEGYSLKYNKMAFDTFEKIVNSNPKNVEYLRMYSYSAAKVGGYIRHEKRGTFSGVDYLKGSININNRILKINKYDEDAILTEAESQIETSSIPVFGGSESHGLKLYHSILRQSPNNIRANIVLAKYYYGKGKNPKNAIEHLNHAISAFDLGMSSNNMMNYYIRIFAELHLVRCYNALNNPNKAWEHLKKHLSMLPRSPSGLSELFSYLMNIKKDRTTACLVAKRLNEMVTSGHERGRINQACN